MHGLIKKTTLDIRPPSRRFFLASVFLMLLMFGSRLKAQNATGTILGSVKDASGAVITNGSITLTNTERNAIERTLRIGKSGEFIAPQLPIGKYSIKVEAPGFKTSEKSDLTLTLNDQIEEIIVLDVGNVTQTVSVKANALHVDTESAAATSLISGAQIRELALESRNYESFVSLMPGVVSNMSSDLYIGTLTPGNSNNSIGAVSMNGSNGNNNWTIDGIDNVDRGDSSQTLDYPSVDAIDQVSVLRGNYDAEYGRSAGGQVNLVTRSGTSNFHGDIYEFFRNNVLDANDWGNKAFSSPAVPRTPLRYNDFGGTFGGPVFVPHLYNQEKNRTFFFYSQEVRRIVQSTPTVALVPSLAERGQNPGSGSQPIFPYPICLGPVNGPGSCPAGDASTTIPVNMINPAAAAYLKDVYSDVPAPQNNLSDQLASNQSNQFNANQEIARIDHNFNGVLSGFARLVHDSIPTIQGGGLFSPTAVPNVAQASTKNPGWNAAASLNFIFSPTLLNQLTYGWSFDAITTANTGPLAASNSPAVVDAISLPYAETINNLPNINFGASLGSLISAGIYTDYSRNNEIFDNLTKIIGRHALKFGFVYNHYEKSESSSGNTSAINSASFSFIATPDTTLSNGNDPSAEWHQEFANFLMGTSTSFSQLSQNLIAYIFQNQFEIYGQDEFRIHPNVTLSYGVRYSMFRQPTDGKNMTSSFLPSLYSPSNAPVIDNSGNVCTPQTLPCDGTSSTNPSYNPLNGIILAGKTSPFGTAVANQSNYGLQPRVGFAWDLTGQGKMSIRGGYGLFFDASPVNNVENGVFVNPPFVQITTIYNTSFNNPAAGKVSNNSVADLSATGRWHQPYSQQWDIDFQRQLAHDVIIDIGYYGSKGTHLLGAIDANEPQPGAYATSPLIQKNPNFIAEGNSQIDGNTEGLLNLIRPYIGYGSIDTYSTVFSSNYNSLQLSLQKHITENSLIEANYTWSKALTNFPGGAPQNSYNLFPEYGPSGTDDRNVFNTDFVYDLPFFLEQKSFTGKVLGGWEASGIVNASSGEYASPSTTDFNDPGGLGLFVSTNTGKQIYPDQLSNPNHEAPHTRAEWYNVNAFQNVPNNEFRPGDARRATILGPGKWSINLTAMKNFTVTQNSKLQFRIETYNLLNHTNYNNPDTDLGDGTTGQVLSAGDNRILQLGLKYVF